MPPTRSLARTTPILFTPHSICTNTIICTRLQLSICTLVFPLTLPLSWLYASCLGSPLCWPAGTELQNIRPLGSVRHGLRKLTPCVSRYCTDDACSRAHTDSGRSTGVPTSLGQRFQVVGTGVREMAARGAKRLYQKKGAYLGLAKACKREKSAHVRLGRRRYGWQR